MYQLLCLSALLVILPLVASMGGDYCDNVRYEMFNYEDTSELKCRQECRLKGYKFAMYDFATEDGFCMCSQECNKFATPEDGRRYRIWQQAYKKISYDGRYCNDGGGEGHHLQHIGYPANERGCHEWCRAKGQKSEYCQWDYGMSDGYCMAAPTCRSTKFAGDRRKYNIWQNSDVLFG